MNERLQRFNVSASVASVALIGMNASLAVEQMAWAAQEPAYVTTQEAPSYSFFKNSLNPVESLFSQDFAKEVASIYVWLSEGQEPLGPEFEVAWDENIERLYES